MPNTIDITPTWGEIGRLMSLLIRGKEWRALDAARPEIARAFAMAEAIKELRPSLTEAQLQTLARTVAAELTKQGY